MPPPKKPAPKLQQLPVDTHDDNDDEEPIIAPPRVIQRPVPPPKQQPRVITPREPEPIAYEEEEEEEPVQPPPPPPPPQLQRKQAFRQPPPPSPPPSPPPPVKEDSDDYQYEEISKEDLERYVSLRVQKVAEAMAEDIAKKRYDEMIQKNQLPQSTQLVQTQPSLSAAQGIDWGRYMGYIAPIILPAAGIAVRTMMGQMNPPQQRPPPPPQPERSSQSSAPSYVQLQPEDLMNGFRRF